MPNAKLYFEIIFALEKKGKELLFVKSFYQYDF